jgi:hypothetical protein
VSRQVERIYESEVRVLEFVDEVTMGRGGVLSEVWLSGKQRFRRRKMTYPGRRILRVGAARRKVLELLQYAVINIRGTVPQSIHIVRLSHGSAARRQALSKQPALCRPSIRTDNGNAARRSQQTFGHVSYF